MFGSNKKDPLVDAVAKVMQENELRRQVERQVNETYGIHSKKALPFEKHAEYDRVLAEKTQQALNEGWSMKKEELVGQQHKIDANKNNKIDSQDFKILKAKKGQMDESGDMGPAKGKKEKTTTYRHKTSGKEVVGVRPPPGDGWEVVKEESTIERIKNNLGLNNEKSPKKDPNYKPDEGPSQADKDALTQKIKDNLDEYTHWTPQDGKDRSKLIRPSKTNNQDGKDHSRLIRPSGNPNPPLKKNTNPAELKEAKYSAKAARAGEDIGKPGKNFEMIAKKAGERYGSEERGKKVAGAVLAKIRAKHMKEETIEEKAPEGAKFERMVKHIKDKYSKDGLTDKEKSIAYATAWKAKNKEEK
jgi:hypothetical protein